MPNSEKKEVGSPLWLFCSSYPEIENTLFLAANHYERRKVTIVIPGDVDLSRFFSVMNEKRFNNKLSLVYFHGYLGKPWKSDKFTKALRLLPEIHRHRKHLQGIFRKYFTGITGAEIYFFTRCMNPATYYFLERLKDKNRLLYMHYAYYTDKLEEYAPKCLSDWANLLFMKSIYSPNITLGKLPHVKGFPCIPESFMKQSVSVMINHEQRGELLKGFDLKNYQAFDIGKYSVIFFEQPLSHRIPEGGSGTYKEELNRIFGALRKYFRNEEIAYKYHPRYPHENEPVGEVLPDFIPAELLYNDAVKIYLSTFSCSIANVNKGVAVSLANLITFQSDELREQLKETLKQRSRSSILFPESLEEFEQIIKRIKEQNPG